VIHAYLGLAGFDVWATAVGYALLYGLGVVRTRRVALRSVAFAFFTGIAVLGVVLTTALSIGIGLNLVTIVGFSLLVTAVSLAIRRRFSALDRGPLANQRSDPLTRMLVLGGAAVLVLALGAACIAAFNANADASYDIWINWVMKGKAIYYFHHLSTGLSGTARYVHINYPLLLPTLIATEFHWMGGDHPVLLPLQQSIILTAFFGSVVTLLSAHVPRFAIYPWLAMLVVAPAFWLRAIYVLPDLTLAYFIALAALTGILWLEEQRTAWLILATIFLATGTLIKNEGLPLGGLLIVALVGAAFVLHGRRGLQSLVLFLGIAIIEPWHLWLSRHGLPTAAAEYDWHELFHPHYLDRKLWRLTYALESMERWILAGDTWLLVPPLVVAALLLVALTHRTLALVVAGWLIASFFGISVVFWIGRPDVGWYVGYAANRIMTTLPIVACTAVPLLLGLAIERRGHSSP
jgi:hypothetical protein